MKTLLLFVRLVCLMVVLGGGAVAATVASAAEDQTAQQTVSAVNINTASAEQLETGLTGVGATRAAAIVEYREAHGPFTSKEQLLEVKGIGQSTLDKNADVVTLN